VTDETDKLGIDTRAVHPPPATVPAQPPFAPPVYRTSVFQFGTAEEYADVLGDRAPGYVYSRIDNPTTDAFAAAVAALEGADAGQPFASGMAAISTTLLTFLSAGDHVVAQSAVYGGTYGLLHGLLPRWGIETTFVDSVEAAAAAMRPTTRVVWAETLANPTMRVADLPALARIAHGGGALLGVDSTFATPVVCRPLEWGADLVVHSATKYIGGHSDATGGVVVGRPDLLSAVRATRSELGGMLAPDEGFLLHRGLTTLPLRVRRHCESALAFARALAAHPRIAAVDYPGLPEHPDHALARELFTDGLFGGVVTITPYGDRAAGQRLCNALRIAGNVTSLGGAHTIVSHIASTTHRQLDGAALTAAGVAPAAVRVSIGLEDVGDLVADFSRALEALPDHSAGRG
jgi:cystathionine beta-lyase/cystathionine gamma-synthase